MKYVKTNPNFDLIDSRNQELVEKMINDKDSSNLLESIYYSREHIYRNRYSKQNFEKEPPNLKIVFLNDEEFTCEKEFQDFYTSTNNEYRKSMKDTLNHAIGIY